jgi:hypothetical protein
MRAVTRHALTLSWWVVALVALLRIGRGPLATPPLGDVARFREWLDARDGIDAAFALLRLGAITACIYLVAVTALELVACTTRSARLARVSELATTPMVRRLVGGFAGLGLSASLVSFTVGGVSSGGDRISVSSTARTDSDGLVLERLPTDDPVVVERVDEAGQHHGTATMRVVVPAAGPAPPPAAAAPPPPASATWTVTPGESLWGKAEAVLAEAWGRPPTDREITPYWRSLVDANRSRLADPGNPDLIFSGQVLDVPPPPAG